MKRIKRIDEFLAAEPTTRPTTAPPITTPDTPARPQRPGPTVRPGEKEKEKPLAALNDLLDQFLLSLKRLSTHQKEKA